MFTDDTTMPFGLDTTPLLDPPFDAMWAQPVATFCFPTLSPVVLPESWFFPGTTVVATGWRSWPDQKLDHLVLAAPDVSHHSPAEPPSRTGTMPLPEKERTHEQSDRSA